MILLAYYLNQVCNTKNNVKNVKNHCLGMDQHVRFYNIGNY